MKAAALLVLAISTCAIAMDKDETDLWAPVSAQRGTGDAWLVKPGSVQRASGEAGSYSATVAHKVTLDGKPSTRIYTLVVTRCGQARGELLLLGPDGKPVEPMTIYERSNSGKAGSLLALYVCRVGGSLT